MFTWAVMAVKHAQRLIHRYMIGTDGRTVGLPTAVCGIVPMILWWGTVQVWRVD